VRLRAAHVVLLLLSMPPAFIGAAIILRGASGDTGDTAPWGIIVIGAVILAVAIVLAGFALYAARREARR
jgi:hypothetical protein